MKIVCISDTHEKHKQLDLPKGDVLIHAGDFTCAKGTVPGRVGDRPVGELGLSRDKAGTGWTAAGFVQNYQL